MLIELTDSEINSGIIDPAKLQTAATEIASTGYVVMTGLVSPDSCALLMEAILEDVDQVREPDKLTPHEKATGVGHLQLGLRRYSPYVKADIVANPLIEQVVAKVLGHGAWLGFYNGNVNCPGSVHQPLHFDRPFSWKSPEAAAAAGQSWPPPTTTLSCSLALSDITTDNGATEIYPGTHHETAVTGWPRGERPENHPELVEHWGPPSRMAIPAGGICFRDPRMWHRGVPNPSDQPRPMIAITYHAEMARHWRGLLVPDMSPDDVDRCQQDMSLRQMDDGSLGDGRLVFDASAEKAFTVPSQYGINRNVRFVSASESVDHLRDAHLTGGARVVERSSTGN